MTKTKAKWNIEWRSFWLCFFRVDVILVVHYEILIEVEDELLLSIWP